MTHRHQDPILYTKPSITEREIEYATDAARSGWGPHCYDYLNRFETAFGKHIGVPHAHATSSCTGALHLGMAALGIGPGDEVVLGDTNWIATAAPIVHLGARPLFVDVLPDTWCLDPVKVENAITPRTKAIVAVHLYGNLCDMEELLTIGKRYGVPVIEDAAEAIGSKYNQARAGSMGIFGAFSFHGTKTLTTGEGGMLVTSDSALFDKVRALNAHGRNPRESKQFWSDVVGYKYRMSNLDAAIGLAQLERVEELIQRKREIFLYYRSGLSDISRAALNPEPSHSVNGYWMPTIVFDPKSGVTREALLEAFREQDVDARVIFWPLSSLPPFGSGSGHPIAAKTAGHGINLPSYHDMTHSDQDRVIEIVRSVAI